MIKMDLEGRTAIVTGAARGIGKDIALRLMDAGCSVIGVDLDKEGLDLFRSETKGDVHVLDVSEHNAVLDASAGILRKYEKIDIIVNNAGITRDNLIMRMEPEDWDKVLNVNLRSAFNMVKIFHRNMLKNKWGRIINISSVIGLMGNAGQSNYAASKGGLISFTKSIAKEFSSRNVTSNAIAPGFIRTKMTDSLSEEVKQEYFKVIPLKRFGEPQDVANIVVFLASDLAGYITGQVINCDGGLVM